MKQTLLTLATVLGLTTFATLGQTPIDVTERTVKIGANSEEVIYFGFAEGDQIIFSFNEVNGKELKEVEILEYPSTSKFSDYKTTKVENKIINVNKKAVYKFRFYNAHILSGRICKIKIQRIPANEQTKNFVTNVNWITKQDTTWNTYTKDIIIGYDTTFEQKTKKELVKSEQKEELIFDKPQRVHSISNSNGNKTNLFFTLPQNEITTYKTTKVIAWAYWVGVGEEANQAWKKNSQTIGNIAKGAAAMFATPLGGAVADLMVPTIGEDVYYAVADKTNKDYFMAGYDYKVYDQGKGVAGYRKFTDTGLCQGTYYILLSNDNVMQGIDATVKVIAIIETNIYEDKQYTEQKVTPKYEKKIFKDPIITTTKVPVTGQ
jgi:hypothetical protein